MCLQHCPLPLPLGPPGPEMVIKSHLDPRAGGKKNVQMPWECSGGSHLHPLLVGTSVHPAAATFIQLGMEMAFGVDCDRGQWVCGQGPSEFPWCG